jgi:hypothetical protein
MPDPERTDIELRHRLHRSRPRPSPGFVNHIRRRMTHLEGRRGRPPYLWALVGAYLVAGAVLLILAAASATGGGAFS